jgi:hypothetical protein
VAETSALGHNIEPERKRRQTHSLLKYSKVYLKARIRAIAETYCISVVSV